MMSYTVVLFFIGTSLIGVDDMPTNWGLGRVPGDRPPTAEELRAFDKAEELAAMASVNPAFRTVDPLEGMRAVPRATPKEESTWGRIKAMIPDPVKQAAEFMYRGTVDTGSYRDDPIARAKQRAGDLAESFKDAAEFMYSGRIPEDVAQAITSPAQKVEEAVNSTVKRGVDFTKEVARNVPDAAEYLGTGSLPEDVEDEVADLLKGVTPAAGGDDEEKNIEGNRGLYPTQGEWGGEHRGGAYLSARYPREFATWGEASAGEGWKHIAQRGGWDSHTHPAHTSIEKRYKQKRAVQAYRSY